MHQDQSVCQVLMDQTDTQDKMVMQDDQVDVETKDLTEIQEREVKPVKMVSEDHQVWTELTENKDK